MVFHLHTVDLDRFAVSTDSASHQTRSVTLLPRTMTEQVNRLSAPVYLKHADVSMIRGHILITICNAANHVTPNNIVGAYKSRGILQIAVKTQTARAQILTQGISIDKHLV